MKSIHYFLLIFVMLCSCSSNNDDVNNNNSNSPTYITHAQHICNVIVECYPKRTPLIAQDLGVDEIVIDSLVLIKDWEQPYNGYFITHVTKNNVTKKVYFKVNDIKEDNKYITWDTDFTMPDNIIFDKSDKDNDEDNEDAWYMQ